VTTSGEGSSQSRLEQDFTIISWIGRGGFGDVIQVRLAAEYDLRILYRSYTGTLKNIKVPLLVKYVKAKIERCKTGGYQYLKNEHLRSVTHVKKNINFSLTC
jgi:hypothetical protein